LDTRQKIVSAPSISENRPIALVVGYFDPLHASQVRSLRELHTAGNTVVVAIDDPPDPLLARRARAELAASLAAVHYVVTDVQSALNTLTTASVHDLRAEHRRCRESISADVVRRYRAQ
jgi:hypothetical protein